MSLKVVKVDRPSLLRKFIEFPISLYKEDPNYVTPLFLNEKWTLSDENPFFRDSEIELYIAIDNGEIVGRIAAIYNIKHIEIYNDNTSFFGYFDLVNDNKVASILLEKVKSFLEPKGINKIVGPTNLSTNDVMGVLSKGYSLKPCVMMPYNYSYYNQLLINNGFSQAMQLYSYRLEAKEILSKYNDAYKRVLTRLENNNIRIRALSNANFNRDIENFRKVYNECNKENWGFLPLDEEAMLHMAKNLKTITPLDLVLVAEKEENIIAFIVAVPDINQALNKIKNGRLFPFGLFKLLYYKRKINRVRLNITGVLPEYESMGIGLVLNKKIAEEIVKRNFSGGEASYILRDNYKMNSILNKLGGVIEKEYKMYSIEL